MAASRTAAALTALLASAPLVVGEPDCEFRASYPRQYVAYRLGEDEKIDVDGKLDDTAWERVGWTADFVDIETQTTPRLATRAKMRYDDEFLYVGAWLEEPQAFANISSTCHCNEGPGSEKDQVVFHDNDFEIFIDADGGTHYYKEFEMNALNATWDLCLDKPYWDGGNENSTRKFGVKGFDDLRPWGGPRAGFTGAHVAAGEINRPSAGSTEYWTAEVALPFYKLAFNTSAQVPPRPGRFWRINFSRVQWAVDVIADRYIKAPSCQSCRVPGTASEDNWVWSRQGVVDMHRPERWGMLQFADARVNQTHEEFNPEWPVRSVAAAVYYAEHAYATDPALGNGTFSEDLGKLRKANSTEQPVPIPHALDGACGFNISIVLSAGAKEFVATVTSPDGKRRATINTERLIRVKEL